MKIVVKSNGGKKLHIPIPTGIVLNRFTAAFAPKYLKKQGIHVTKEQAVAFVQELNRYRSKHPEWVLVEAKTTDGEYVEIKL